MSLAGGLVIDASVAIKWLIDEDGSDTALSLRDADLAAPALLRIEVGNVLRTLAARQAIAPAEARDLFAFFQEAPVAIADPDDALERRALDLALDLGHPIYDCVYLALAERMDRRLVTADLRFARALGSTDHAARILTLADVERTRPSGGSF
ncbi:type II toxin-antitoxin system VapC family toxin [Palleronia sp. LCG004]|uniref:type II toxin-antitoxin system VapC family toxin n=1 Tax=Palleronia sp. LCG004 TaxID=3079304 RepID=UPI0029425CD2|nr:type II toxin-antitoxin system VapC family toxin [Palleronia sp. LCG004]WOI57732.1 type II toxin-antitoxin system VapC family toxin [Palleronia sp. LCG004]